MRKPQFMRLYCCCQRIGEFFRLAGRDSSKILNGFSPIFFNLGKIIAMFFQVTIHLINVLFGSVQFFRERFQIF